MATKKKSKSNESVRKVPAKKAKTKATPAAKKKAVKKTAPKKKQTARRKVAKKTPAPAKAKAKVKKTNGASTRPSSPSTTASKAVPGSDPIRAALARLRASRY